MTDYRFIYLMVSLVPGLLVAAVCIIAANLRRTGRRSSFAKLSVLEGLFLAGFVLFSAALLYPVTHSPWGPDHRPICLSNVKSLNLGMLMYLQDFDDRFPPASQWGDAVYPYIRNRGLFKCPQATSPYGYAFNKSLDRLFQKMIKDDKASITLFEANATSINAFGGKGMLVQEPRHDNKNVFGFADGHAAKMPKDAILRWGP